jgi:thiol:disulfide interchange protein DsbD
VWWYGHYTAPGAKPGRVRLGTIGGIALIAIGAFVGWPREAAAGEIEWEPWSTQRVAELRAQNRTIYVDFTARWCFTCQTNKKLVFGSEDVRKLFREKKVATLKGDWTNRDPKITAELAKWQRSAVPFNLIYKPGAKDPVVLPEVLTAGTVLDALK